jgi:hypothetical protein
MTNVIRKMKGAVTLHPVGDPVIVFDMSFGIPSLKALEEVIARHKIVPGSTDEIELTAELVNEAHAIDKATSNGAAKKISGPAPMPFFEVMEMSKERVAMAIAHQRLWHELMKPKTREFLMENITPESYVHLEQLCIDAGLVSGAIHDWAFGLDQPPML